MDKGKYVNNEHTTIEELSDSIVSLILNEGKVVIPELGYLELKVFSDKRTVLFKATENSTLFLISEGSIQSRIYANISVPLKEGKVVVLPEVGIFHPIKKTDGSYRISFIISSSFRKLLNGGKEVKTADDKKVFVPVVVPQTAIKEQSVNEREKREPKVSIEKVAAKDTEKDEEVVISAPKREIRVDRKMPSYIRNTSKVGDLVVTQEEKKRNYVTRMRGIIAVAAAIVALMLIVWYFLPDSKSHKGRVFVSENTDTRSTKTLSESTKYSKSIDLPALAEQKYGNRIFWVYIYDANKDKISSPVNIPSGTELRIPNLWEDYKVDVMDSMEITRAGIVSDRILSDIMLNRKIQF